MGGADAPPIAAFGPNFGHEPIRLTVGIFGMGEQAVR